MGDLVTAPLHDLFVSPDREHLVRDSLLKASTEEDAWELVEATISFTQANHDPRVWLAIAPVIPPALHDDAHKHLALITDEALREQLEQALRSS
jgi:hypothetical protein